MIEILHLFCCERSVVDNEENNLSAIGIFTNVELSIEIIPEKKESVATEIKPVPIKWHVMTLYRKTNDDDKEYHCTQHLKFVDPNGKELASGQTEFTLKDRGHNVRIRMLQLPVTIDGKYLVKVSLCGSDDEGQELELASAESPVWVSLHYKEAKKLVG